MEPQNPGAFPRSRAQGGAEEGVPRAAGEGFGGKLANWQVYWQLRLITPQKDINVRPPVGGPCFVGGGEVLLSVWFFLSSFSLGR